jgi:hypothetical protein
MDRAHAALERWKSKPEGKTVGLNIPPGLRKRLFDQMVVWDADSYRQLVHTCVDLGLAQLEAMSAIKLRSKEEKEEREEPVIPTPKSVSRPSVRPEIENLRMEVLGDSASDPMEEVPEVPRSSDQGDDEVPAPEWDEGDLPR